MKNRLDSVEALRDAVALRAGLIDHRVAHPDASVLATSDSNLLRQLAIACVSSDVRAANPAGAFGRGLGSDDFKNVLSDVLRSATVGKLTAQARHRAFCDVRRLKSFMPHDFPSADIDISLVELAEGGEAPSIEVRDSAGLSARIRTWGRDVNVSREVVLNDDVGLLVSLAANAGASAARLEASLCYELLESNPVLGDGETLFHTDHGNVVNGALDEANFFAALAALRDQRTPAGIAADLDARFLVVASGIEGLARKLLHSAGIAEISVIASAAVPPGRWYLLADPAQAPVIALLRLEGSSAGVLVGPVSRRDSAVTDGVLLGVRFDVGAAAVGRVGAVRGGA